MDVSERPRYVKYVRGEILALKYVKPGGGSGRTFDPNMSGA